MSPGEPQPTEGDVLIVGQEPMLAPGVRGVLFDTAEGIYIPFIVAEREGSGDVGRYLDSLPRDRRVVFPTVISRRLAGMLARRGFREAVDYSEEFHSYVDIFERKAVPNRSAEQLREGAPT
jgi:hypothetical protein